MNCYAQADRWDSALDHYASICKQCISLRQRSQAGESISAASLADLISQLSSLKETLQRAAGEMTPSQQARFHSIRMRYKEEFSASSEAIGRTSHFLPPLEYPSFPQSLLTPRPAAVICSSAMSSFVRRVSSPSSPPEEPSAAVRFGILAFLSVPPLAPGLMARLDIGRAGLYVKGSLRPVPSASYECLSDGTTPSGGVIWTSGNERQGAFSASAGATFSVIRPQSSSFSLRLYAGAGYGSRSVQWEDATGGWAQVSDQSIKGLEADAGALMDFGRLSLMVGASTIPSHLLSATRLEIGAGFLF